MTGKAEGTQRALAGAPTRQRLLWPPPISEWHLRRRQRGQSWARSEKDTPPRLPFPPRGPHPFRRPPGPRLHLGGRPRIQRTVPPGAFPPGLPANSHSAAAGRSGASAPGSAGRGLHPARDRRPEASSPPAPAATPQLPLRHPSCREMPQPRLSPCGLNPNLQPTAPNRRTAPAHGGERAHEENALEDGSPEGA